MSRHRSSLKLARQTGELALAAPQVVAHRVTRMLLAGAQPSARDRREFTAMGAEKVAAFQESWMAMGMQAWRVQQQMAFAWWQALFTPWARARAPQWPQAMMGVLGQGLAPVHRRAVANARRLGRPARR
jgi:hypothetical protein